MKFLVITKWDKEIVEADDMYDAVMLLPWGEGYEPFAIVEMPEG